MDKKSKQIIQNYLVRILCISIIFFVVGEIYFRLPWTTKFIRYEFDKELGHKYAANQTGSMVLGNFSFCSPPIKIDEYGLRNAQFEKNTSKI